MGVAELARDAGAFASPSTYYYSTREACVVEAACREVLYVARQAETSAAPALTGAD